MFHDAFTMPLRDAPPSKCTGRSGSLFGVDCMTQRPKGTVLLRSAQARKRCRSMHENLYQRSVRAFQAAIARRGAPAASGEDGVQSMALALATLAGGAIGARGPRRSQV